MAQQGKGSAGQVRATARAVALVGLSGIGALAVAPADAVALQREALEARVAAVRQGQAVTSVSAAGLTQRSASWNNWPNWSKWSNWANQ